MIVRPNCSIIWYGINSLGRLLSLIRRCLIINFEHRDIPKPFSNGYLFLKGASMGNFLRSLFGSKKSPSKIKPRLQSRRLELLGLEERVTPAVVSNATGIVTVTLGVGESITNLNAAYNASNQLVINTIGVSNTGSVNGVTYSSSINGVNDIITVDDATFAGGILGLSVVGNTGTESVTVGGAINLVTDNNFPFNSLSIGSSVETLNVNAAITAKAGTSTTGAVTLAATAVGIGSTINTTAGNISITGSVTLTAATTLTTTGGAIAITGAVNGAFGLSTVSGSGAATITGIVGGTAPVAALSINSTGPIGLTGAVTAGTIATVGAGAVTLGGTVTSTGPINFAGAVTGTTSVNVVAGTTATFGSAVNTPGVISVLGLGDLTFTGSVGNTSATSVTAKSLTGDVIFGNTVTSSTLGGFISEATSATKATKIANLVTLAAGANAVVTGNLISNNATLAAITTSGVGNITITGNVDASVANNNLTLTAGSAVTIGGNVGSSSTAMGDLISTGTGLFLASGNVTTHCVNVSGFTTSITFVGDVKTNGVNGVNATAAASGSVSFAKSIEVTNAVADVNLTTVNGNLTVTGAIIGKEFISISSTSGLITLGAISTDQATGDIFINNRSGNIVTLGIIETIGSQAGITIDTDAGGSITTSGTINTSGIQINTDYPDITIQALASGNITVGAPITTTGTGYIYIGYDVGNAQSSANIINAPITTSGVYAGDITIYTGGSQVAINQPITAGTGGSVVLITTNASDVITVNAAISAKSVLDNTNSRVPSIGTIQLGADITTTLGEIDLRTTAITLSGPVSMKAQGTTFGDINLGSIDGAQNLTLEATDQISLGSVGQTTPLNTFTVTNSRGASVTGNFTAANVVLTDTTGLILFDGNTTITSSLSTAAKSYNIEFGNSLGDTTVLAGAPVFSNTGNVAFFGTTTLTSGATIIGGSLANVNLAGTIVSGGAFNIGAGLAGINVSDNTQLILNSITAGSTFASPINLNAGSVGSFNLLGVGTLTLSANSTAGVTTGDTINVTNGSLNVTGTLGSASTITLTNGTLTGPGGAVGNLTPANGTVDPEGTLNTGTVTFNAATTYIADVLTSTTATNLTGNSGFNLGGSAFCFDSVVSGLGVGNTFTIINNTAVSGGLSGTFAGLPEGATLSALDSLGNTITFAISYVGGTGANDVTLTVTNVSIANPSAIPQPMVAGQPLLNYLTAVGAGAGGGPMVTVTLDIIPGLTTVPTYFSFFAYDEGFTGGVHVALNELDGNTDTKEIITGPGAGGGPNVKVFQFNIRTLTFNPTPVTSFFAFNDPTFSGGVYVAGGDVTGDGIGDLLVGAGAGGGPRVQVYAGSLNGVITSAPISDFFAYSTEFLGGVVVAAGDRTGDSTLEVVTGPASNGGYNIKSFNVAGTGNNPTLIENFFAFNDFTSIGGLSIATAVFDANPMDDLVIGTTNTEFGVILNQDYEGILANPFPGFDGEIRAGFVSSVLSQTYQAVAAAGPGGGPVLSVFSVDPINLTLTQTDSLFVLDPEFTGGLFVAN